MTDTNHLEINQASEHPATRSGTEPPVDFIDTLLFPCFVISFVLVLVVFDVIQRFAALFGEATHQRSVRSLNLWLVRALRIVGTRFAFEGQANIPASGPVIVVSNHQSLFDIPLLDVLLETIHPRFIGKKELGRWIPSVSYNLRRDGNGLIDRKNPRQAIPELKRVGQRAVEGEYAVVLFPEGTRARRGALKEFQNAGLAALLQSNADALILPIAIDGSWRLACRSRGPIPRRQVVRMRVLPAFRASGAKAPVVATRCRSAISDALDDMRGDDYSKPSCTAAAG